MHIFDQQLSSFSDGSIKMALIYNLDVATHSHFYGGVSCNIKQTMNRYLKLF